jgi:ParB family chromosome partitioning protein
MNNKRKTLLHINPKNIIVADNFNSRCDFGDIEELANQIAKDGLLNPIHVRYDEHDPQSYILVDGERRYRAIMHNIERGINIDIIPALLVDDIDIKELFRIQIQANEGKNFNEYEYALAYQRLQNEGMSMQEISEFIGKKPWHVNVCLAHLKRDSRVQELLRTDRITGVDVRHIYQAHKKDEAAAVNVILKLAEYADEQGEHKLALKNLKTINKDIKLSDNVFDKTTVAMDTVAIKNALNKLSVYMAKVPAENRKKFSIKYIIDQLNKGEMIDNILEINNVINRAE